MERRIDRALTAWSDSDRRKPLLLRGARQVGKTTSVERLGRDRFDELVTVDLERREILN